VLSAPVHSLVAALKNDLFWPATLRYILTTPFRRAKPTHMYNGCVLYKGEGKHLNGYLVYIKGIRQYIFYYFILKNF
jgi:hypothetical protein